MRSRLRVSFAVLMLLVGLAALSLWVRSCWSADLWRYGGTRLCAHVMVIRGTLWFAVGGPWSEVFWMHQALPADQVDISDSHHFACIGWSTGLGWFPLGLPLWLFTLPGLYAAYRLLPRRRTPAGHCPHCGYDLRATPDRCPECGTPAGRSVGELKGI